METVDNIHYLTQDQWRDKYKMLQRENSNLLVLLKNEQLLVEEKIMVIKLKDVDGNSVMEFDNSGCCLESVNEETSLDENTTVSFSYYFPIIR